MLNAPPPTLPHSSSGVSRKRLSEVLPRRESSRIRGVAPDGTQVHSERQGEVRCPALTDLALPCLVLPWQLMSYSSTHCWPLEVCCSVPPLPLLLTPSSRRTGVLYSCFASSPFHAVPPSDTDALHCCYRLSPAPAWQVVVVQGEVIRRYAAGGGMSEEHQPQERHPQGAWR